MTVTVLSGQRERILRTAPGRTLMDVLREAGISVSAPCGGQGTCGKCTVYQIDGQRETAVLACRTPAEDGMVIRVRGESPLQVRLEGTEGDVLPADGSLSGWGACCDVGTTTVVCRLVDRASGRVAATVGEGNAQRPYGGDVIARIRASMDGLRPALTRAIRSQLSEMLRVLCAAAEIAPEEISELAVAGNTTMCHLLTGLSPDSIGTAPFTPLSRFGDTYAASELELPFPGTVYVAPAVSGYVGGDITADLLAAEADRADAPILLIDVGTNGEMALGCGTHFVCCSAAAGPAFEGAEIRYGMTAAPGAVSGVRLDEAGRVVCTVVGGGKAEGLCGSGLIDALAVMLELGVLDETGRLLDPERESAPQQAAPYLFLLDGEPAFRLADGVAVTQSDVRKVQLGKGAIAAGTRVLMDHYGVKAGEIGALLLAGGFGSCLRPESAARIGLIPRELLPVTRSIGNAAVQGAGAALVSQTARARLTELQESMDYLELSSLPAFGTAYLDEMMFPEGE